MRGIKGLTVVCVAVLVLSIAAMAQQKLPPMPVPVAAQPAAPANLVPDDPSDDPSTQPTGESTSKPSPRYSTAPASEPATMAVTRPVDVELVESLGDPAYRHGGNVTRVLLLDAGRMLTTGIDGTVRIWDRKTGKQLRQFEHSSNYVWDAAVAGKLLYTATGEKAVVIWDIETGKRLAELGHKGMVFRLSIDPAGKYLAASDEEKSCVIWDLATRREIATLPHGAEVYTVVFDAKGERLVTGCKDSMIREWKVATQALRVFKEKDIEPPARDRGQGDWSDTDAPRPEPVEDPNNTGDIFSLAMSPDKSKAIVCCSKRSPWLMDAGSGLELWRSACEVKSSHVAAWSPDGKLIVICGDGKLCAINAEDGKTVWTADVVGDANYALTCDDNVVYCGMGHVVARFDIKNGKRIYPEIGKPMQSGRVEAVVAANRLGLVLESGGSPGVRVWDMRKGTLKGTWLEGVRVESLSVSQDESRVVVKSDKGLTVFDIATGKVLRELSSQEGQRWYYGILVDNGKKLLALRGEEGWRSYGVDDTQEPQTVGMTSDRSAWNCVARGPGDQIMLLANEKQVSINSAAGELLYRVPVPSEVYNGQFISGGVVCWGGKVLHVFKLRGKSNAIEDAVAKQAIKDLASEDYSTRQKAVVKLSEAAEAVLALLDVTKVDNKEHADRVAKVAADIRAKRQYVLTDTFDLGENGSVGFSVSADGKMWYMFDGQMTKSRGTVGDFAGGKLNVRAVLTPEHVPATASFDAGGQLILGNCNGTISVYKITENGKPLGALPQATTATSRPAGP